MHERSCPRCGSACVASDSASGTVWECSTHGVVDWYFEATAAHPLARRT